MIRAEDGNLPGCRKLAERAGIVLRRTSVSRGLVSEIANACAQTAFVTGPGWIILFAIGLRRRGRQALWMLPGLPFALRGTTLFLLLALNGLMR